MEATKAREIALDTKKRINNVLLSNYIDKITLAAKKGDLQVHLCIPDIDRLNKLIELGYHTKRIDTTYNYIVSW